MKGDPAATIQLNLSESARVAGRDYFERACFDKVPDYWALLNQDELDELVPRNEIAFHWRFRFWANERLARSVVEVRRAARLTDPQIRFLKRTNCLETRDEVAELRPSLVAEVAAYVQVPLFWGAAAWILWYLLPYARALSVTTTMIAGSAVCMAASVYWIAILRASRLGRLGLARMSPLSGGQP